MKQQQQQQRKRTNQKNNQKNKVPEFVHSSRQIWLCSQA